MCAPLCMNSGPATRSCIGSHPPLQFGDQGFGWGVRVKGLVFTHVCKRQGEVHQLQARRGWGLGAAFRVEGSDCTLPCPTLHYTPLSRKTGGGQGGWGGGGRVGGDYGELRPCHYLCVHSIESRLIMRVRYKGGRHLLLARLEKEAHLPRHLPFVEALTFEGFTLKGKLFRQLSQDRGPQEGASERFQGLFPERPGQNLAFTVLCVSYAVAGGRRANPEFT